MINIPLRPKDDEQHNIPKLDKEILTVEVLTGWSNERVYAMFHPELATESFRQLNVAGKRECRQFHTYNKNKAYKESYEETLEEFLNGKKRTSRSSSNIGGLTEEEKKTLKGEFADKVYRAMGEAEGLEQLKDAADLGKTAKILKEEETVQEAPRRYLPARCLSECSYRLFVESHIKGGDIVSECDYCRTRKFAEDNGWRFDATKNLDLPNTDSDEQDN